jgi:putative addiction module killer protein
MSSQILTIRETEIFARWMRGLADPRARAKIAGRIDRLAHGNAGDSMPVGEGISEMRIHYGPGYRVYYTRTGDVVVLLVCGGTKSSQTRDIKTAKALVRGQP